MTEYETHMQNTLKAIARIPGRFILVLRTVHTRALEMTLSPLFRRHGTGFRFDPHGTYSFSSISVGNDVHLGSRPSLLATRSQIKIGDHVMFGPEVTIRGGNHRIDIIGRYMKSITGREKRPRDDKGVTIEDDVWVGTRAIILQGVTIGRGAIVAAGAVVTHNVPPYAIVAGIPARVLRFRWKPDIILQHEEALYPIDKRISRQELVGQQNQNQTGRNRK